MIIVSNPINPYLIKDFGQQEKIFCSPQKVADNYAKYHSAMSKIKQLPIVYISTMGLTEEDINESDIE